MDLMRVENIELNCLIGCSEEEQSKPRLLVFDIECPIDVRKSATTDNLDDALDYVPMVETVRTVLKERSYHLIETVAEQVAERLLKDYSLPWVVVRVKKPRPTTDPAIGAAVVEVRRP